MQKRRFPSRGTYVRKRLRTQTRFFSVGTLSTPAAWRDAQRRVRVYGPVLRVGRLIYDSCPVLRAGKRVLAAIPIRLELVLTQRLGPVLTRC